MYLSTRSRDLFPREPLIIFGEKDLRLCDSVRGYRERGRGLFESRVGFTVIPDIPGSSYPVRWRLLNVSRSEVLGIPSSNVPTFRIPPPTKTFSAPFDPSEADCVINARTCPRDSISTAISGTNSVRVKEGVSGCCYECSQKLLRIEIASFTVIAYLYLTCYYGNKTPCSHVT